MRPCICTSCRCERFTEFYGFSGGTFYVSNKSGATFTTTAATGLPTSGTVFIKAMPGHAGDIWLTGGSSTNSGVWHSTNSGATFTKLTNVSAALNIGFGKAAPEQTYMALYTIATIGGVQGIFRSDDAGANCQLRDAEPVGRRVHGQRHGEQHWDSADQRLDRRVHVRR